MPEEFVYRGSSDAERAQLVQWCTETFGEPGYRWVVYCSYQSVLLRFYQPQDVTIFLLTWPALRINHN